MNCRRGLSFTQLYHLAILHIVAIDHELDDGPYAMPALVAGSPGVHVKALEPVVIYDLQDMRMPADKKFGRLFLQLLFDSGIITGRITADMGHEYGYSFTVPAQLFGVDAADIIAVDIAIHAFERFDGAELFGNGDGAKVARVPDLVAIGEMRGNGRIEPVVCI